MNDNDNKNIISHHLDTCIRFQSNLGGPHPTPHSDYFVSVDQIEPARFFPSIAPGEKSGSESIRGPADPPFRTSESQKLSPESRVVDWLDFLSLFFSFFGTRPHADHYFLGEQVESCYLTTVQPRYALFPPMVRSQCSLCRNATQRNATQRTRACAPALPAIRDFLFHIHFSFFQSVCSNVRLRLVLVYRTRIISFVRPRESI